MFIVPEVLDEAAADREVARIKKLNRYREGKTMIYFIQDEEDNTVMVTGTRTITRAQLCEQLDNARQDIIDIEAAIIEYDLRNPVPESDNSDTPPADAPTSDAPAAPVDPAAPATPAEAAAAADATSPAANGAEVLSGSAPVTDTPAAPVAPTEPAAAPTDPIQ